MTRWGWLAAIGAAVLSTAIGAIVGYEIGTYRGWAHNQRSGRAR
jgi:ABC-type dipeptide/oligopeptide/nickel transport system permease subunit